MVTQISIHKNDEITSALFNALDVCAAKTHLAWSSVQDNLVIAVDFLQFSNNSLSTIRTSIINDNNFEVQFTTDIKLRD